MDVFTIFLLSVLFIIAFLFFLIFLSEKNNQKNPKNPKNQNNSNNSIIKNANTNKNVNSNTKQQTPNTNDWSSDLSKKAFLSAFSLYGNPDYYTNKKQGLGLWTGIQPFDRVYVEDTEKCDIMYGEIQMYLTPDLASKINYAYPVYFYKPASQTVVVSAPDIPQLYYYTDYLLQFLLDQYSLGTEVSFGESDRSVDTKALNDTKLSNFKSEYLKGNISTNEMATQNQNYRNEIDSIINQKYPNAYDKKDCGIIIATS